MKKVFIFLAGMLVGSGAGAGIAYAITKKKLEEQMDDELIRLRDYYEKRLKELGADMPEEKAEKDSDDGICSVGEGLPADKKVDTSRTDYTKCYKSTKKVDSELTERIQRIKNGDYEPKPRENDDYDEGVYEIAYADDEMTGEPGYGNRPDHGTISMTYYADGALCVSDWGSLTDSMFGQSDADIENEEDMIRGNVLECLQEMEFMQGAYDRCYIRDCRDGLDVEVTRVSTLSDMDNL